MSRLPPGGLRVERPKTRTRARRQANGCSNSRVRLRTCLRSVEYVKLRLLPRRRVFCGPAPCAWEVLSLVQRTHRLQTAGRGGDFHKTKKRATVRRRRTSPKCHYPQRGCLFSRGGPISLQHLGTAKMPEEVHWLKYRASPTYGNYATIEAPRQGQTCSECQGRLGAGRRKALPVEESNP